MVFTVQVLRNQENINGLIEQIASVRNQILELNILSTSGAIDGGDAVRRSRRLSTSINNFQREQRRLEEENAFLIKNLGFNPINELDTEREKFVIQTQDIILPPTITPTITPTIQNNTLRNALIIGGLLLVI